ncbi:MAG TPA: Hpt domain-containing protein [Thermoanaerobaculia bacterium]|jgi:chemotaxis protein histidine kinase CheA
MTALDAELRARFRETAAVRLDEMQRLLEAPDARAVEQLARHFHALAGLGGTYGYPQVSELADRGEASAMPLMRANALPNEEQVSEWRALVVAMRDAIE